MSKWSDYMRSEKWKRRRRRTIELAGGACEKCGVTREQGFRLVAHHLTYDRLGDELDSDLKCLCEDCHNNIHDPNRRRRGLRRKLADRARKRARRLDREFAIMVALPYT